MTSCKITSTYKLIIINLYAETLIVSETSEAASDTLLVSEANSVASETLQNRSFSSCSERTLQGIRVPLHNSTGGLTHIFYLYTYMLCIIFVYDYKNII